jgi:hypothetical protein
LSLMYLGWIGRESIRTDFSVSEMPMMVATMSMPKVWPLLALIALSAASGCGSGSSLDQAGSEEDLSYVSEPSDGNHAEEAAYGSYAADEDVSVPEESDQEEPRTFKGYTCTGDCSGHEAGYAWAEENGISDPDDCGGNSNSFIEGCEAYAEE